ncbi:MAG: ribosome small subunit-dependent GTPase A [Betaproteobacteria bacterium]
MSAVEGLVTATHRRHYAVALDDGTRALCVLRGRSSTLACGDRVVVESASQGDGAIVDVLPRSTLCYRSDAHREKLIAANVTQVLGIVAPDPRYDDELVNRWTIAAESNGCRFILVANKSDLPQSAALAPRLAPFAALGYPVVHTSALGSAGELKPWLDGQRSVLIGQSGMGKSTLINALVPDAAAKIGEVSASLQTGRHTTTQTTLYPLDAKSWIVDSPGMQEFGLAHLDPERIENAFVELRPLLGKCRFRNCRHDAEPGCAVQDAVDRGDVLPWRLGLLHSLLADSRRRERTWE